jgi:hypothetical protein
MKKTLIAVFLLLSVLLLGCSVKYTANSVTNLEVSSKEICVIEDTSVRESFLPAYRTSLEKRGFTVRVLSLGSDIASCPITSTYTGRWSWDFVPYMAYAEIIVYRNGTKAGDALYEAPRAGWALTTDIYDATELKIETMVDKLFPTTESSKKGIE